MDYILLKSRAKINLTLDILGKRDDGYHNLETIMQTLTLYDTIFIKKIPKNEIIIKTNIRFLPVGEKNIVYKTAQLLKQHYNIKNGIFIDLKKNIPVSAGLAGGSGNCAATLVGMNRLFELGISYGQMMDFGASLGSDVPFCLLRGTVLATGTGNILKSLKPHPDVFVVIVTPPVIISTADIFKEFDINNVQNRPDNAQMIKGIKQNDLDGIANNFCNVLESVTVKKHPIILDLKNMLIQNNAMGALMSGSGPTVFGYFKYKTDAINATNGLKKKFPKLKNIYITTIFNPQKRTDANVRRF